MTADDSAVRARQRDLVRRGYDAISEAYRSNDGQAATSSAEDVSRYAGWVAELAAVLPAGARVLDLGCGAGIPATRELAAQGLQVSYLRWFEAAGLVPVWNRFIPEGASGHALILARASGHPRRTDRPVSLG